MTVDPRDCGAKCNECPLGPRGALSSGRWRPVLDPRMRNAAEAVAVIDHPAQEDERNGNLLSGKDGTIWQRALAHAGKSFNSIAVTSVIKCAPHGNTSGAYSRMNEKLAKINKRRVAEGTPPLKHPVECCKPMLFNELRDRKHLIMLGKLPSTVLSGITRAIDNVRGAPIGINSKWQKVPYDSKDAVKLAIASIAPRRLLKVPARAPQLHSDIQKGFRLFTGTLDWEDPDMLMKPTPAQLRAWFDEVKPTRYTDGLIGPRMICDDVETSRHRQGMRPTQVRLRTLAFARWKDGVELSTVECVGVPLLSTDNVTRFYTPAEELEIRLIIRQALADPDIVKIGHNAAQFDRIVYEANGLGTPAPRWDSIFPTRAANPSWRKGLKPNGRTYTDVGEWDSDEKEGSIATGTQDDGKLLRYNCFDTAVNLILWSKVCTLASNQGYFDPIDHALLELDWWDGVDNKGWDGVSVPSLFDIDHSAQDRCVYMHYMGHWVNQEEVERQIRIATRQKKVILLLLQSLLKSHQIHLTEADLAAVEKGDIDIADGTIKPGSTKQLANLYFGPEWDLPFLPSTGGKDSPPSSYRKKDFLTMSGGLSTSDTVHRQYLASGLLEEWQFNIMYLIRVYRRISNKIIGTSLRPMRAEVRTVNEKTKTVKYTKSFLYDDGYIRPNKSAFTTSVGRLAANGPNDMNIGNKKGQAQLKKIYQAPPGYILFGCDINQAHLFIIANAIKIPSMVEAIANDYDPHNYNALLTFGSAFENAPGYRGLALKPSGGSPARAIRDVMKTFFYASIYGAAPETVWGVLTATEMNPPESWLAKLLGRHLYKEDEMELADIRQLVAVTMPYIRKKVGEVRDMHAKWLAGQPAWQEFWEEEQEVYLTNGCLKSFIFGRSSGDLGGDVNKQRNFRVLATESDLMRIIEGRVERRFPRGPKTGLFYQCHDSVGVRLKLPSHLPSTWAPTKDMLSAWSDHRDPSLFPEWIKNRLLDMEDAFRLEIPGWRFPIKGEADVGRTLKDI